jgi:hypothetical protein
MFLYRSPQARRTLFRNLSGRARSRFIGFISMISTNPADSHSAAGSLGADRPFAAADYLLLIHRPMRRLKLISHAGERSNGTLKASLHDADKEPREELSCGRSQTSLYNDIRTHRSLDKDAPVSRPVQSTGSIKSHPILGGLHHHYARV